MNIPDKIQQNALDVATTRVSFTNDEALMEAGADQDITDHRGQTPLHQAAKGTHELNSE